MTVVGWLQAIIFFALIIALTPLLGGHMARVFQGERNVLTPIVGPLERLIYRLCRIDPEREMSWKTYALAILAFSVVGSAYLYLLLRTQAWLPLNPQHFGNMAPASAWNTTISFLTNTNWQFYSGEIDDELSLADGRARVAQLRLGRSRYRDRRRPHPRTRSHDFRAIGNFWVDLTRTILYVLLPISIVAALLLVWQGDAAKLRGLPGREDARRRDPDDRLRPDRLAGDIKSSGPTAAASSTRTPPTHSRTPRRSRTSSRCSRSS